MNKKFLVASVAFVAVPISFFSEQRKGMLNTIGAIIRQGKIELIEDVEIPEGTEVLVTPLVDEHDFWLRASSWSLSAVWDNTDDDVYAEPRPPRF